MSTNDVTKSKKKNSPQWQLLKNFEAEIIILSLTTETAMKNGII